MLYPSKREFLKLAKSSKFVPIVFETGINNKSPCQVYEAFLSQKESFLLESVKGTPRIARYSLIGLDNFLIFKSKDDLVEIEENGKKESYRANPIKALREIFKRFPPPKIDYLEGFFAGAVGYLGYDLVHFIEELPKTTLDDLKLPDCYLLFPKSLIIFDHLKKRLKIVVNLFQGERYEEAKKRISEILLEVEIAGPAEIERRPSKKRAVSFTSNFTKDAYLNMVKRAKEYIKAGDIYQANLSQRLSLPLNGAQPFRLYKLLQEINPSPFSAYLNLDGLTLVSSSPERLVRVRDGLVETRPIAGTRPRGREESEDRELEAELILSSKERAEHIMLVDLERNDLGRVCEYGSVVVDEMMTIERYSHVMHIVSNIKGDISKSKDIFDVILACFPGGTITGVPKVRCMEIIDELEPTRRGPYTGSIGYLGFNNLMDLNIIIRTFVIKDGQAHIQVGGGIVADSDPEHEYFETLDKAEALIKALEGVV